MTTRQRVYTGKVVDIDVEQIRLPNNEEMQLEIVRHPGGAAIVAVNDDNEICLIHQYRHIAGGFIWELPAGKIDDQEPPLVTAQRELAEEAGTRAVSWFSLGTYLSSPGIFDEVIHLWLARVLHNVPSRPDAHEVFDLHWMPFSRALQWAHNGKIRDGKTLVGICRAHAFVAPG